MIIRSNSDREEEMILTLTLGEHPEYHQTLAGVLLQLDQGAN
jgi:hypothetical protein